MVLIVLIVINAEPFGEIQHIDEEYQTDQPTRTDFEQYKLMFK